MPVVCRTCQHPARREIEALALQGVSPASLSRRFGVSDKAIARHIRRHAKRDLNKAAEARNGKAGDTLLLRIQESREDLYRILKRAERTNELTVAVNAIQGGLRALELEGRVTGEISSGGTQVNVMLGMQVNVAQSRLAAYDQAKSLPAESVIERACAVLRAACESGDVRAGELVRELVRSLPRSSAEVID